MFLTTGIITIPHATDVADAIMLVKVGVVVMKKSLRSWEHANAGKSDGCGMLKSPRTNVAPLATQALL